MLLTNQLQSLGQCNIHVMLYNYSETSDQGTSQRQGKSVPTQEVSPHQRDISMLNGKYVTRKCPLNHVMMYAP